jgi:DNA-directed RNA polymerase specialized sigma subunit
MSISKAAQRLSQDLEAHPSLEGRNEHVGNFHGVKGAILARLDDFERLFVVLYYAEHMTNAEIGEIMEITPGEVAELHAHVLRKLRSSLATSEAA